MNPYANVDLGALAFVAWLAVVILLLMLLCK